MTDWLISTMESLGYWGIALLMFLENIVPPIPSEVIMPFAGFTAKQGNLTLWGAILAGTVGSLAGAVLWYGVARVVGTERLRRCADHRHCRWIGLTRRDVDRADAWFDRWGKWAVLFGRMVPGVRTVISIPAGLSEMPLVPFLLYSLCGTAAWSALLAWLGWMLGQHWQTVNQYMGWITLAVVAAMVIAAIIWLWRRHHESRQPAA